jgi:excisionase family DNA binding protein
MFHARTESALGWSHRTMNSARVSQLTPRISLTVLEAASATGFSENYFRLLIARQAIPHVRIGRVVRVMVSDLERFLEQHRFSMDTGHSDRTLEEARWRSGTPSKRKSNAAAGAKIEHDSSANPAEVQ